MRYGEHISYPEWSKLEDICHKIENLKQEAKKLRKKIDEEILDKKLLKG